MSVPARMSIITLGVDDLERSKNFYAALGWKLMSSSVEGVIYWFQTADGYLGLHPYKDLAADGRIPMGRGEGFGGVTLAINVDSDDAVIAAFEAAIAAGATPLKPPEEAIFGGLDAYFADPDGYPWEVGHNPHFPILEDGTIQIP